MKRIFIPLVFAALAVSGCSPTVPKCGDEEVTDLVKQIADEEMNNQLGAELAELFSYEVGAIRTTATNEKTVAYECAAELSITASNTGMTNKAPITYTVEMTDDGEQFYVNVFGL